MAVSSGGHAPCQAERTETSSSVGDPDRVMASSSKHIDGYIWCLEVRGYSLLIISTLSVN